LEPEEKAIAHDKWLQIVKAYETLTDKTKFHNYVNYGNPDGSLVSQSFNVALPGWMRDEKNQVYILLGFFVMFVVVPMIVLWYTKEHNNMDD